MTLVLADRVKEITTSVGTNDYLLNGPQDGFQGFGTAVANGDTVYYTANNDTQWEVGTATYVSSTNTLTRVSVFSSSDGGTAINWPAGSKNIFLTYPAEKAVYVDLSGNVGVPNNLTVGGTVDGVDIAARDAVLTSTTTTANAALPKAGGTMTGAIAMGTFKVTGAGDPTDAQDLATKTYVDTIAASGLHYHTPVRVETATNRPATYNNGASGVGATLTNSGTQEALIIDGVTVNVADRILIQTQTDATQNGVYTVTDIGSGSTNWVLTRATDADSYGASDKDALGEGDAFFVSAGNTSAGELYVMNTPGVIIFGTTDITFTLIAETAVYTAGTGMALTGTVFSIGQDVGTGDSPSFVNVTAGLTGNASTATALATGRTIGMTGDVVWTSAAFDGSGNVTGTATIQPDSVALGTDTTGNYVAAGAVSGTGLSGSSASEGGTFTVTSNATALNTASTIVARDISGNFAAGTVTAALSGNATTATALATGRTISLTGDVTGTSAAFDGSGNVSIAATIAADSVALGTDTTGNYVQSVANGSYLTGGGAASEGTALTLGVDAASINTASKVVARDASGNFAAGTITAALTGNASTATTLQTARTIGGVSFDGSANINLPGVNTAGTQATSGNADTATQATRVLVTNSDANAGYKMLWHSGNDIYSTDGIYCIPYTDTIIASNFSGPLSGNATTATTLQTARTINGVSFNGSADITVADSTKLPLAGGTVTGSVVMSGDASTTYGPNSTWAGNLRVGGNGSTATGSMASIVTTNGNLHMDGGSGSGIYLNWYNSSSGGVVFGNGNSGQVGSIDSAGNLTMSGNVTAYSDVRLKSNIQTIESGLDKVCAMRGVTFEKDGVRNLGVIAQEVEAVIPEVVHTQNDGMKSVAYGNIVGVLIEAIKELKQEIETLKGN